MDYLNYAVIYLLEFIKLYLVLRGLTDLHLRKKSKILLAMPVVYVAFVILAINVGYNFITYFGFVVIMSLVVFDDKRIWKLLLLDLWAAMVISVMDYICSAPIRHILNGVTSQSLLVKCISSAITIGVVTILGRLVNRFYRYRVKISLSYYILTLVVCFCNGIIITVVLDTMLNIVYTLSTYIVFYLAVASMLFEMGTILMLAATKNVYKEKDEINRQYLRMQAQHYTYLKEKEEKTRKFRHDVLDHMNIMDHYISCQKYEELSEYIEEVRDNITGNQSTNRVTVNCDIADAIINQYIFTAAKDDVAINVTGMLPDTVNISSYDLCTIISNIIRNAVEAVNRLEDRNKRTVELEFKYDESFIMINISNYYEGRLNIENGVVLTKKADLENHGIGLVNVGDAIANYNGSMTIDTGGNRYFLHIILHNK